MDILGAIRAFRQHWVVIAVAVALAALVTFAVTPERPRTAEAISYTATATLIYSQTDQSGFTNQSVLERVALFATVGQIPQDVADEVDYEGDPAILASRITTGVSAATGTVTLSSTGEDGTGTADLVNAFADQTVDYFSSQALEQRNAELAALEERVVELSGLLAESQARADSDPGNVQLQAELNAQQQRYELAYAELQDARAAAVESAPLAVLQPATPIPNSTSGGFVAPSSRPARVALGAGLGLLFGLGLALLLERSDARIRTRDDVEDALGIPVIAEVPRMTREDTKTPRIAVLMDPLKAVADAYRNVRSAVLLMQSQPLAAGAAVARPKLEELTQSPEGAPQVVLVTSGHAREGKTTTVANVAAGLAETGRRVLVLDADFRAPNVYNYLDVPEGLGLSDHLDNPRNLPLKRLLRPTNVAGVQLLEAGTQREHPAVIASQMGPVIEKVRSMADIVVIDSAPLLHANDTLDMIPYVDTVLLVTRSGRLTTSAGRRVVEFLRRLQAPVLGVVLVGSKGSPRRFGYGSYGYGYGYSYGGGKKRSPNARHARKQKAAAEAESRAAGPREEPWDRDL